MNEVMGETTLRIPYAEHARHGCHFMNAFVLLALLRPQAGKEVSGFNFLYLIVYIHHKYRIYIYIYIYLFTYVYCAYRVRNMKDIQVLTNMFGEI